MTLPHAEYAESAECFFENTNHANFTKDYNGSVGSRLDATEWTGTSHRIRRIRRMFFVNTNHANFTKDYNGNVGSRLGATEWILRKYN